MNRIVGKRKGAKVTKYAVVRRKKIKDFQQVLR